MNRAGIQNTLPENEKSAERRCSAFSVSEVVIGARNEKPPAATPPPVGGNTAA